MKNQGKTLLNHNLSNHSLLQSRSETENKKLNRNVFQNDISLINFDFETLQNSPFQNSNSPKSLVLKFYKSSKRDIFHFQKLSSILANLGGKSASISERNDCFVVEFQLSKSVLTDLNLSKVDRNINILFNVKRFTSNGRNELVLIIKQVELYVETIEVLNDFPNEIETNINTANEVLEEKQGGIISRFKAFLEGRAESFDNSFTGKKSQLNEEEKQESIIFYAEELEILEQQYETSKTEINHPEKPEIAVVESEVIDDKNENIYKFYGRSLSEVLSENEVSNFEEKHDIETPEPRLSRYIKFAQMSDYDVKKCRSFTDILNLPTGSIYRIYNSILLDNKYELANYFAIKYFTFWNIYNNETVEDTNKIERKLRNRSNIERERIHTSNCLSNWK